MIDVADEDATRQWAARCPGATWGAVEVRRIRDVSEYS
ncbi:YciI family protein [Pelagibacterium xiamenense]